MRKMNKVFSFLTISPTIIGGLAFSYYESHYEIIDKDSNITNLNSNNTNNTKTYGINQTKSIPDHIVVDGLRLIQDTKLPERNVNENYVLWK